MRFQAEELSIFKLLMGFLRDKNLFETLNSLQLEIGQAEEDVGSDLLYLQRIILQGRWDDVLQFIKPFGDKIGEKYEKLEYIIHRQQLLEALSWQGGGGHRHALLPWKPVKPSNNEIDGELEIEVVVDLLKSLERTCPPHEFNSLCLCLTLEKLSDNPDFALWTVSQGRLDTFQSIKNIVSPLLEINRKSSKSTLSENATAGHLHGLRDNLGGVPKGGLLCMLAMALAYQVQKQRESASGRGHSAEAGGNMKTVFNGSILLVEGAGGDVLLEPSLLPSIAVTGAIANTLFGRDSNISYDDVAPSSSSSSRTGKNRGDGIVGGGPHTVKAGRYQSMDRDTLQGQSAIEVQVQVPSQSHEQALSRGAAVRPGAGADPGASEDYSRSQAATDSGISSSQSPSGIREAPGRHSGPSAAASSSPEKLVSARAAPVAWTVEGEPKRDKNVENEGISRVPQSRTNRRATVVSARSPEHLISRERIEPLDSARAQTQKQTQEIQDELERDRSYVTDPSTRLQTHQPSSSSAGRNRRDTITNVDNSSRLGRADADRDRDKQGDRLPTKQTSPPLDLKSVVDSTLLLQAECPLRCVCSLSDQINSSKPGEKPPSSSSWMVAVGSNDKSVKVLRISDAILGRTVCASAEIVSEYPEAHRGSIYAMDWRASYEGQGPGLLASASNDKAIRILNVGTGTMSAPLKGHTGTIRSVIFQEKFGRDSSTLLASAGAGDNRPRLWDVSTGASHSVLAAHTDAVHGLAWLSGKGASGSDQLLLSGCEGGVVMAHDTRMSSPAWTLDLSQQPQMAEAGSAGICCFSALSVPMMGRTSDGLVVAGCTGGYVCIINTTDRSVAAVHRPHTDDVRSIALHGGGPLRTGGSSFGLVTTSFDGLGAVWCVNQSSNLLYSFQLESMLKGHEDKILGVCSIVRNKTVEILTTGADGKAILWTQKTNK